MHRNSLVKTYKSRGLTIERGEGLFLFDEKGKKYLDLMSNYGANIFGHSNKKINQQIKKQIDVLFPLHASFDNDIRNKASNEVIKRAKNKYKEVFWSNSGAEAIEAALKFSVLVTGKKKFIYCKNGFHGKTLGALSATYGKEYRQNLDSFLFDFTEIPFNDLRALEKAIDKNTSAFIVEPIQGDGGVNIPSPGYLKKVREICSKKNILLIIDEVQTGSGRTGYFLASEKEKVVADILTLGKGLAGGLSVGATLVNSEVAKLLKNKNHTSTFGGSPLVSAGVLATLSLLTPEVLKNIKTNNKFFVAELNKINSKLITEVRGEGFMIGIEVKKNRDELLQSLQDEGLLAIPAGKNVVRFLPAFILSQKEINQALRIIEKVFAEMA